MAGKCIIPTSEAFAMKRVAFCLGIFLVAAAAAGQTVTARVDGGAAHSYVVTLSSPEWQGRRTLTPGFDKAAEWAAARFREWGLQPAGDAGTFFQAVPVLGPRSDLAWTVGMPALSVGGRDFSFKEGDFIVDSWSSPATDVTAEAIFAGYGISAPEKGFDEYAGLDVTGKVVFVLRGSPKDAPPEITDFPGDPPPNAGPPKAWTEESSDQAKITAAYRHGAAAVVLCDANPEARRAAPWTRSKTSASIFSRPFLVVAASDPRILRSVMLRDPLESLVGFVDRINRIRRATQQGTTQSAATGVRVRVKGFDQVEFYGESFGRSQSRNVLAKLEGSDPVLRNQAVVIGAHLDHLGYRSGLIHPGADDNASGSAVALEVARVMASSGARPKRTVIFALWCGEEFGHHGSKKFTASPAGGFTIDRLVAYINMDMVGLGTGIEAAGARDFPSVFSIMMRDQLPEIARTVTPEGVGPGGSDYQPFLDHGVDAISLDSIGGNGHPDYHDSGDIASKVQPEMLGLVGQFVLQAALNLANETKATLPVPGRRETCDALRFSPADMSGQSADGWRTHPARSSAELQAAILEAVGKLKMARETDVDGAAQGEPPSGMLSGVRASAAGGNLPLLATAIVALDIARLDIEGDDGTWVKDGLTMAGKGVVAAMDKARVAVNLVAPSPALLADVLAASTRPVLVSGIRTPDEGLARRVRTANAALALDCSPGGIDACASSMHALRTALGSSGNLLVSMHVDAAAAQASHRALYHALAAKGWTKEEIFAVGGQAPDGQPGGNLARFTQK
jgi:hypothetical protein